MEEVHYLVYHHIKGNVCGKLAKKFLKAVETEVDTENEPLQSLSHIINSSEKSKIAHPTSKKRKLEAEPSEDQIKQANIAAKLLNYDPLINHPRGVGGVVEVEAGDEVEGGVEDVDVGPPIVIGGLAPTPCSWGPRRTNE
ncbi:hypothetical protein TCAL_15450 [Tigriopus californicus]|uniref:Uncharacterized protein n=1 Tax=Tigriopus californicus TaxID=6832 RepID=A0A553PRQ1_TIGCA|nr:hypothetical protein TCAL_15450 [Tigriopus californicus]